MSSSLERLIDAAVKCLCCGKGRTECECDTTDVRCGVCLRCATHCHEFVECDKWWTNLFAELQAGKANQ